MKKIYLYCVAMLTIPISLVFQSALYGISSDNYALVSYNLNSSGGSGFSSDNYRAKISFGENALAVGESAIYKLDSGFIAVTDASSVIFCPLDLGALYVYPNPYKPGSGGIYDAPYLTFRNLTSRATIRIFNIALEHIATIEKDSAVYEYQWIPKNDSGKVISSGLYIYYITDPNGHTTKGKFTIIR